MSLETQVNENTTTLQVIIDESKTPSQLVQVDTNPDSEDVFVMERVADGQKMGVKFSLMTPTAASGALVYNYSSILPPQLFNPTSGEVTGGTAGFALGNVNRVAFVTLNGQVLDDADYTLVGMLLSVTPYSGFSAVTDEVLVFQHSFAISSSGGVVKNWKQKSAIYTVDPLTDYGIETTTNTFTITLPTAVGIGGQEFVIKNSGTGVVTIDGDGTETIDGYLTISLTQYDALTLASNGANWIII